MSFLVLLLLAQQAPWPQWGGPNRNFTVEAKVKPWAASGPKKLWTRALGEGYSGLTAANGKLYTMYHRDADEVVIAIKAQTGKTLWEYSYYAPFVNDAREMGPGPNSQPLLVGDRLFSFGVRAKLNALDAKTGKLLWSAGLRNDYEVPQLIYGHPRVQSLTAIW
jgi:outer membrane protein assembly factor BamB